MLVLERHGYEAATKGKNGSAVVLNVALTPLGKPEAESVTWPLKPLDGVILSVLVAV